MKNRAPIYAPELVGINNRQVMEREFLKIQEVVDQLAKLTDGSEYLPATLYPNYKFNDGTNVADKEDVWETETLSAKWLYAHELYAVESYFADKISSVMGLSSSITDGAITGAVGGFTEVIALGGIVIPASAEDLPFSVDEDETEELERKTKSIQNAFIVEHEKMGRTVEIDKEGDITVKGAVQAAEYLDADGNPATVSPSTMVNAFTTLQTAIADETTIEGIKTALTNSLGGLIEKFEGMKNDNL